MTNGIKTRNFFTSAAQHFQGRGKVIQYPTNALEPSDSTLVVVCEKHNKTIKVQDWTFDLTQALTDAFNACPGCLDEVEAKTSRWPEGAEL